MIRSDARAFLLRWLEVAIGIAVLALGVYGAMTAFGFFVYVSFVLIIGGLAIIRVGVRRARFPVRKGGAGVVEVDERQITYFGPLGGAAVSIDALVRVEVETTAQGPCGADLFWVFYTDGAMPLRVPGNAEGVATLFDALAALPGVDYQAATSAAAATGPDVFAIWTKERRRLH